ncbi:MAG: universal stress protein [Deltaproteobacteria bacterium]|jgi:nucleotide-binding universal stress UspA family protein|nr:universal stress protein [Deltaproteobacteria bacterium]
MNFKKILIAVDASENSMRAVRYVGEIVGSSPGFEVTLLHVAVSPDRDLFPDEQVWKAKKQEMQANMELFFRKSRTALIEFGVPSQNIHERYIQSGGGSLSHQILGVQESDGFGTIVIGRRGVSKEEEFLFGSVSNKIVHYAKGCTVWVVE